MASITRTEAIGILLGTGSGVFWGLPFLVPQLLPGFSALEIAFGRFFFFGIVSLVFLGPVVRVLRSLSVRSLIRVGVLSATGFWAYSAALFWAVQKTDGILSSLVLGMLPVTIPWFSSNRGKRSRAFLLGLFLILAGISLLFLVPYFGGGLEWKKQDPLGMGVLFLCLTSWTWYAIANSEFLRSHGVSGKDLSSTMGILSLLFMLPLWFAFTDPLSLPSKPQFPLYVWCSFGLGAGASWFANWLWNLCCKRLPSRITGTLLVSETLFGLIYSFAFEGRPPRAHEGIAIGLALAGVAFAIGSQFRDSARF
jgi:drug/metabolite transporter (DMT)-like permease